MSNDPQPTFKLDGKEYLIDSLSDAAKGLLLQIKATEDMLIDAQNMMAIFTRAKNSYVQGLKDEIIRNKAGL